MCAKIQTLNRKQIYDTKTLTYTFHYWGGAYCQGAFVLDPLHNKLPQPVLAILFRPFGFIAPKTLN